MVNDELFLKLSELFQRKMALQTVEQLKEENRVLKNELERLEELLVVSRAERDQIGIRYNAISERVSSLPSAVQRNVCNDHFLMCLLLEWKNLIVSSLSLGLVVQHVKSDNEIKLNRCLISAVVS